MNGEAISIPQINLANPLIQLLEGVLAEARAGRLGSVAVVAIGVGGGVAIPCAGGQLGDLYVGAGLLQRRLMNQIEAPPQRSSIIPARMGA